MPVVIPLFLPSQHFIISWLSLTNSCHPSTLPPEVRHLICTPQWAQQAAKLQGAVTMPCNQLQKLHSTSLRVQWPWMQQEVGLAHVWGSGVRATHCTGSNPAHTPSTLFCCAAAAQVQRPSLTFEEEEQMERKDHALGSLLDRLGGSIHGTALNISPTKVSAHQHQLVLLLQLSAHVTALCAHINTKLCCSPAVCAPYRKGPKAQAKLPHTNHVSAVRLTALPLSPACTVAPYMYRRSCSKPRPLRWLTAVGAYLPKASSSYWSFRLKLLAGPCRQSSC